MTPGRYGPRHGGLLQDAHGAARQRVDLALAHLLVCLGQGRAKLGERRLALRGRFGQRHRVMPRAQLDHVDHLDAAIGALDDRIDELMAPFAVLRDLLDTVTGIGKRAATGHRRPRSGWTWTYS